MDKQAELVAKKRSAAKLLAAGKRVEEIARELGVAQSTLYKWKRQLKSEGALTLLSSVDRRFSLPGFSPGLTQRFVEALAKRMPDRSADQLSEFLMGWGREIEPRTIRNMLTRANLGTRHQRLSAVLQDVMGEESDDELLRQVVAELADTDEPNIPLGTIETKVLVQGAVPLHRAWQLPDAELHVVSDTFDGRIFAHACNRGSVQEAINLADEAIKFFHRGTARVSRIFTARQRHYSRSYSAYLISQGVVHELFPVGTRKRDPYTASAWQGVLRPFLERNRDSLKSWGIDEFNDSLHEHLRLARC